MEKENTKDNFELYSIYQKVCYMKMILDLYLDNKIEETKSTFYDAQMQLAKCSDVYLEPEELGNNFLSSYNEYYN